MQFYRLSTAENQLPKYWSYGDDGEIIDNRIPGFQAWVGIERVLAVAAGQAGADGNYGFTDYPFLLAIESDDFSEGSGGWIAIDCANVKTVKSVKTEDFVIWAKGLWEEEIKIGYDFYEGDFESWCDDSESDLLKWLNDNAKTVSHEFVETLERLG